MESSKLKNISLDELVKMYEELNNFVTSLTKEIDTYVEGDDNA